MERIIKKIEEVKNNLGGFVDIIYEGDLKLDEMIRCGGCFDIDNFEAREDGSFFFVSPKGGENDSYFYLYPDQYTRIEEEIYDSCQTTYYLTRSSEMPHTTGNGVIINIYEYTKIENIRTFFKWLKKKLRK